MRSPRRTSIERAAVSILSLIAGYGIGYHVREARYDQELREQRYTYTNLYVVRRDAPDTYFVASTRDSWEMKFCPDLVPDLEPGNVLTVISYVHRGTCESVADKTLYYFVKREHGEAVKMTPAMFLNFVNEEGE